MFILKLFRHNGPQMMNILKNSMVDSHLDGAGTTYKAPLSGKLSVQRSAVFTLLAEVKKDKYCTRYNGSMNVYNFLIL